MKQSILTAYFHSDMKSVWEIVINNEDTGWRSDLSRIEITGPNTFTEITKGGTETHFSITEKEECTKYAFTMENRMLTGKWTGLFYPDGEGTKIVFTETIRFKTLPAKLVSPLMNLKKMQETYAADLRKKLGELPLQK